MKKILLLIAIAVSLLACAAQRSVDQEELEAAANAAIEASDFGKAIDLAMPKAMAGDPEFQFTVGYLAVLWIEAPSPKEPPRFSLEEAVSWIRKAAKQNLPQAAAFLRSSYEWGRYGFEKNPELEACWRQVEVEQQDAGTCIAKE